MCACVCERECAFTCAYVCKESASGGLGVGGGNKVKTTVRTADGVFLGGSSLCGDPDEDGRIAGCCTAARPGHDP